MDLPRNKEVIIWVSLVYTTYLESNEPDAFDSISNDHKVFQRSQWCDIYANVQESNPNETLIQLKGTNEKL